MGTVVSRCFHSAQAGGIPSKDLTFADKEYWDRRYADAEQKPYDWLVEWQTVAELLNQLLDSSEYILCPGCGDAPFHAAMYDAGYTKQACFDYSAIVIEQNKATYSESHPGLSFYVHDCTEQLKYPDETFSYILDKGMNDSLRCVSDEKCFLFVDEMYRLLKPGGLFVTFSLHTDFRDAKELSRFYERPDRWEWTVAQCSLRDVILIVCEKRQQAASLQPMLEALVEKTITRAMLDANVLRIRCSLGKDTVNLTTTTNALVSAEDDTNAESKDTHETPRAQMPLPLEALVASPQMHQIELELVDDYEVEGSEAEGSMPEN